MGFDERKFWPDFSPRYYWRMWRWRRYWAQKARARKRYEDDVLHPAWAEWLTSGEGVETNPWPV